MKPKPNLFEEPKRFSGCVACCVCGRPVCEEAAMKRGDLYWHANCQPPKEKK